MIDAITFFKDFYTIINLDLIELEEIAKKGEKNYNSKNLPGCIVNTTIRPQDSDKKEHYPYHSRCTIPILMSIFSGIDTIGRLIAEDENTKFVQRLNVFMRYGGYNLKDTHKEALREVYRNGIMHSFFPKNNIGVSWNTQNPKNELFFQNNDSHKTANLNANFLVEIFRDTMLLILNDYEFMRSKQQNIEKYYNESNSETVKIINDLYLDINSYM